MNRALASLVLALAALPAAAQELRAPPPGGILVSRDGSLVMSSQICPVIGADLPPAPGVAYEPGIDAEGKPVAPADLPSNAPAISVENFPIEIRRNLAGSFNVPSAGGAYGAKAILGYVTLKDNRAYFNGQPLTTEQRDVLAGACHDAAR